MILFFAKRAKKEFRSENWPFRRILG